MGWGGYIRNPISTFPPFDSCGAWFCMIWVSITNHLNGLPIPSVSFTSRLVTLTLNAFNMRHFYPIYLYVFPVCYTMSDKIIYVNFPLFLVLSLAYTVIECLIFIWKVSHISPSLGHFPPPLTLCLTHRSPSSTRPLYIHHLWETSL